MTDAKVKGPITGSQINSVLQTVQAMTPDGSEQLSILARALVIGCKSCAVEKDTALSIIGAWYDENVQLHPMPRTNNPILKEQSALSDAVKATAIAHGFAMAAATLARQYDRPTLAADLLAGHGIAESDLRGMEEYDLEVLRPLYKNELRLAALSTLKDQNNE